MLTLKNISKSYQNGTSTPVEVLKNISIEIEKGQRIAIYGPSGSGKSTLLNIMGCLDLADAGTIRLDGQEYSSLNQSQKASIRNQEIGFVFQRHHLLPYCSAIENVLIPTLPTKQDRKESYQHACQILEKLGMLNRKDHLPGQLSGGECQRIAVARALINEPKIILADEPTGALDKKLALEIMELLCEINQELKTSMVIVTHAEEYAQMMHQKYRIEFGHLEVE